MHRGDMGLMQDAHRAIFEKKLLSLFEQIIPQPMYQVPHIGRLVIGHSRRDIDCMRLLIRKEELEASAKLDSDRYGGSHGARPRGGEIHHAFVQTDNDDTVKCYGMHKKLDRTRMQTLVNASSPLNPVFFDHEFPAPVN